MADSSSTDSPLEAAAGAAGPRAVEAFSVLGNETRLSILLALWEEYPTFEDNTAVTFSDLRDRIGMSDSGQFNYHLDKLAGHFIRKTEDGYKLRRTGFQLVVTVIAGTGLEEPTLEPTEIGIECDRCGAPTAVTYQDGEFYRFCTECEGYWERSEIVPGGVLAAGDFDAAGLTDRTPAQAWDAMETTFNRETLSWAEGVCVFCSGPTETSLNICENHEADGPCEHCGGMWALTFRVRCKVCKDQRRGPPHYYVKMHPAVIGFYNERGVQLLYEGTATIPGELEEELVSNDPIRLQLSYEYQGDRLEVLVDEELNVLEVTEPD